MLTSPFSSQIYIHRCTQPHISSIWTLCNCRDVSRQPWDNGNPVLFYFCVCLLPKNKHSCLPWIFMMSCLFYFIHFSNIWILGSIKKSLSQKQTNSKTLHSRDLKEAREKTGYSQRTIRLKWYGFVAGWSPRIEGSLLQGCSYMETCYGLVLNQTVLVNNKLGLQCRNHATGSIGGSHPHHTNSSTRLRQAPIKLGKGWGQPTATDAELTEHDEPRFHHSGHSTGSEFLPESEAWPWGLTLWLSAAAAAQHTCH